MSEPHFSKTLALLGVGGEGRLNARRGDRLPTVWERPAHTKAKHDILVKYLQAWFGIMGSSPYIGRAGVVDGFAGPGVYANGEPGSPMLVIDALLDHDAFDRWAGTEFVFLFNEKDPERFASLDRVIADLPQRRGGTLPRNVAIHAENRNFSELGEELLTGATNGFIPLFAFVDPFGYKDTPMDLIRRLLQYDKAELFIYFDFNSVNRFATSGVVDQRFVELFGTDEFKNAPAGGPERRHFLHDLYESQLRSKCSFAHVRSFEMVNESGHIGNYLFFCTRNLQAFDRMKQAMWALDPTGEYRFEDRLADQDVLFGTGAGVDTSRLQDQVAAYFNGRTVAPQEVVDYVVAETPFHSGHVKRLTLAPMQTAGRLTVTGQGRRGTFPDRVRITFP